MLLPYMYTGIYVVHVIMCMYSHHHYIILSTTFYSMVYVLVQCIITHATISTSVIYSTGFARGQPVQVDQWHSMNTMNIWALVDVWQASETSPKKAVNSTFGSGIVIIG